MLNNTRTYTLGEEITNSIIHGIGAMLAIAALAILVSLAAIEGDPWSVVSFSIFGAMLFTLYVISTLYHALKHGRAKRVFRVLDHISIFLLIAGTYTPFLLVNLRGALGWMLFGLIWGAAILGIILRTVFKERLRIIQVVIYVAMGWLIIFAIKPLVSAVSMRGFLWLLAGGILYTAGITFYALKKVPYTHSIWHICVLGGSVCHFFCMLFYTLP